MDKISGHEYSDLITEYILYNFGDRGIDVYREVFAGKSIIGKNRRVDILIVHKESGVACAVECKYQSSTGTVDEKIPYSLDDLKALPMNSCLAYAGDGFSQGVLHLLQASEIAAGCTPEPPDFARGKKTREFDHLLAMTFNWWDILTGDKKPEVSKLKPPKMF